MNININEKEYNVEETQIETDVVQYMVTPKKRNCKLCGKEFESNGREFLTWTDDNDFLRSGYFCKKDLITIKKVLKEVNRRI